MQRHLSLLYLFFLLVYCVDSSHDQWHAQAMRTDWHVDIDHAWDVLGPFPICAREQHFLVPSFPLDLSHFQPYQHQPNRTWPSSLSDNGTVTWKTLQSTGNRLLLSHPEIRWDSLRATEGWAALQHHNVLHTTLKITPPARPHYHPFPWLSFSVRRASFFTLIPYHSLSGDPPEWHPGNIYAFPNAPKQLVKPSQLSVTEPTYYHLFVSGDYEIRLFGDPSVNNHQGPILDIQIDVSIQSIQPPAILEPQLDVVPDVWQGWIFGSTIGIAICAFNAQWSVTNVKSSLSALEVLLHHNQRVLSSQTRLIPIVVQQFAPIQDNFLDIELTLEDTSSDQVLTLVSRINLYHWTNHSGSPAIKATYILGGSPTHYLAIPPTSRQSVKSPIIALHGAGVEVTNSFWAAALPPQPQSWIICPSGRTSWGLDWHGISADDIWYSFAALKDLLEERPPWAQLTIDKRLRPVVIGHSNGGQGTWYLAAHYPDKIQAAAPAAGYIKSQQYIPLSLSRGSHFLDASRNAVLHSALTPDDNDLFMSNVINTPILAIHGGADENVPVWHTRELVSLVKSWETDAPISLYEEPNQPHWYPSVFSSDRFLDFLNAALADGDNITVSPYSDLQPFTLTVANPRNSGSFHGVSVQEVIVPGRIARLHIIPLADALIVETENVFSFTLDFYRLGDTRVYVDDVFLDVKSHDQTSDIWFQRRDGTWKALESPISEHPRLMGPISNILSSTMPLTIVMSANIRTQSIGRRLAYAMFEYFRLDVLLISDEEAMNIEHHDNIIILGADNIFGLDVLQKAQGLVHIFPNQSIKFQNKDFKFGKASTGLLFLHPHPSSSTGLVLFVIGTDDEALERASRVLLPIRTGVPLPEFLILGGSADFRAAGGLRGTGFFNRNWDWSEEMAWLS